MKTTESHSRFFVFGGHSSVRLSKPLSITITGSLKTILPVIVLS